MEEWSDIKGYEGIYRISSAGNVYSYLSKKVLTPALCGSGYLKVMLCKDKKKKNRMIHRLVAETFIPNPNEKLTVNHKDGNKRNNDVSNLEWNTYSENLKHAYAKGLNKWNPKKGRPFRPVYMVDKETGKILKRYASISEAVREFGDTHQARIIDVCRGRTHQYKGYLWRYADEK